MAIEGVCINWILFVCLFVLPGQLAHRLPEFFATPIKRGKSGCIVSYYFAIDLNGN